MLTIHPGILAAIITSSVALLIWILSQIFTKTKSNKEYNSKLFKDSIKYDFDTLFALDDYYLKQNPKAKEIPQHIMFKSTDNYNIDGLTGLAFNISEMDKKNLKFKGLGTKRAFKKLFQSLQFLDKETDKNDYLLRKMTNKTELFDEIYNAHKKDFEIIKYRYNKLYHRTL